MKSPLRHVSFLFLPFTIRVKSSSMKRTSSPPTAISPLSTTLPSAETRLAATADTARERDCPPQRYESREARNYSKTTNRQNKHRTDTCYIDCRDCSHTHRRDQNMDSKCKMFHSKAHTDMTRAHISELHSLHAHLNTLAQFSNGRDLVLKHLWPPSPFP